jgi:phosphinothricin acetyltransferase
VLEIYNAYVRDSPATFEITPVQPADRTDWLRQHTSGGRYRLLVAEAQGKGLLGWATSSPFRPREAYATTVESSVYCRPSATGRGVGSGLYRELFRLLQGEPIERIVAGIAQPNPASVALHRRFGFLPVGTFTRVGLKLGRYWDVTWYERPLVLPDGPAPTARPGGARRVPTHR